MKKEHEKQTFRRDLRQRADLYHDFHTEFGYLKSAVTTMVKTLAKVIITLKNKGVTTVIVKRLSINDCLKFLNISLSQSPLIVIKKLLTVSLFQMSMTLIFSFMIKNYLNIEGQMNTLTAY